MGQTRKFFSLVAAAAICTASALGIASTSNVLIAMNGRAGLNASGGLGANPLSSDEGQGEKMMMPLVNYTYVAGSNLSDEPANGHVYELQLTGDPEQLLAKVGLAFGLTDEVRRAEYSTPEYPSFIIGSETGADKSLQLHWNMAGIWSFNNPLAYPAWECKVEDEQGCVEWKEQPATPELLPSESEAKATAIKLFAATGKKFAENELTVTKDSMQVFVSASPRIDGFDSPLEWSIGWSSNGTIAYASGYFAKAVDKGDFNTISAKAAVARIADWRWQGSASNGLLQKYYPIGRLVDDMPMIEDSNPEPQEIQLTIKTSEPCLLMILDSANTSWFVPGYILQNDQGWVHQVIALEAGVIQLPEATTLDAISLYQTR